MQNMSICLIEQSLLEIESSAPSKSCLTSFLFFLHALVSKLLNDFSEGRRKALEKDNELFTMKFVDQDKLKSFMTLLGYYEENDHYSYDFSDENVIKLQYCLRILQSHLKQEESAILGEISNNKFEKQDIQEANLNSNRSSSNERAQSKESLCSGRLKDLLLSKHMEKEHSNDMAALIKKEKRPASRSSDFAFNTNGYFLQSGKKAENRRNKSFMRELFHQPNHDSKGWSSSSLNAKLI